MRDIIAIRAVVVASCARDKTIAEAIIIADTGKGFQMDPDIMVQPFKTTKEGGMGLGLYFVNIVMGLK